ncbi:MAG: hypothetical protein JSW45_08705 [Thiotrichales bacterium]|nr:MAG: hypothetical protein JSW45_08705 [Thiotrichales bacterium]
MRYSEHIPPEQLTVNASDSMLLFTAALSILIGMILVYLGRKGKQLWMVTWSIGLIICSVLMGASLLIE